MVRILMTGFEPFGGQKINPSWQAVQLVTAPEGVELIKRELPVRWRDTAAAVQTAIDETQPDAVILTGQAGGAERIRIERVGINLRDSGAADNAGVVLRDTPIFENAPAAYFSTFAYKEMLSAMTGAGLPAMFSYSAGAYLCNEALYTALHTLPEGKVGFIHLPYLPEQTSTKFSLPLEKQALALQLALNAQTEAMKGAAESKDVCGEFDRLTD